MDDLKVKIEKLLVIEYDKRGRFFKDEISNVVIAIFSILKNDLGKMEKCYFKRDFNRLLDYLDAKKKEEGYNQAISDILLLLELGREK